MGRLGLAGLVAATAMLAWGCSDDSRPRNLRFDGSAGGGGFGNAGGAAGSAGMAGAAGSCSPDPNEGQKISGNMVIWDPSFPDPEDFLDFVGQAELVIEGTPCGWAKTSFDGAAVVDDGGLNRFLIEGVKTQAVTWMHHYQLEGSAEDVYPTLILVRANESYTYDDGFGFMRASAVDKIYADTGQTRDPTKATVLAQLNSGKYELPTAGAEMTSANGIVAYPGPGGWALGPGQTDASGSVAILNADADPFPGKGTIVQVGVSQMTEHVIAVEQGAVTITFIAIGSGF